MPPPITKNLDRVKRDKVSIVRNPIVCTQLMKAGPSNNNLTATYAVCLIQHYPLSLISDTCILSSNHHRIVPYYTHFYVLHQPLCVAVCHPRYSKEAEEAPQKAWSLRRLSAPLLQIFKSSYCKRITSVCIYTIQVFDDATKVEDKRVSSILFLTK